MNMCSIEARKAQKDDPKSEYVKCFMSILNRCKTQLMSKHLNVDTALMNVSRCDSADAHYWLIISSVTKRCGADDVVPWGVRNKSRYTSLLVSSAASFSSSQLYTLKRI
ncbi:uncharacterized protein V6R79_020837 [Siganus canaliculatus]